MQALGKLFRVYLKSPKESNPEDQHEEGLHTPLPIIFHSKWQSVPFKATFITLRFVV